MMDATTCPARRPYLEIGEWQPEPTIRYEDANGPVQPPLGQGSQPAAWSHADWPEVA